MKKVKALKIKATKNTPYLYFNPDGIITVKGRIVPEAAADFFRKTFLEWTNLYIKHPASQTKIHITLEYINSSSTKEFLKWMRLFEQVPNTTVFWHYDVDDEDMLEYGEDFMSILNLHFELVPIEE